MSALALPRRKPGRPTAAAEAKYQEELATWCAGLLEINSTSEFKISSRGWCYMLEPHGLAKGDFDRAEKLINDCRKDGNLPVDFTAADDTRKPVNLTHIDNTSPEEEAEYIVDNIWSAQEAYNPFSFWDYQDVYIQMLVEKIDLKSLFGPVCAEFDVPLGNAKGWADINSRVGIMRRFAHWETKGKQCLLLYCGDFDPAGFQISGFLRKNLADLAGAVGWHPDDLKIDRFGLNHDFIVENNLTWIDNLETGNGKYPLDDPRHPDHRQDYVQDYLKKYGARKVEANALVVRPEAGRDLCRQAILKYIDADTIDDFNEALDEQRDIVASEVKRLFAEGAAC